MLNEISFLENNNDIFNELLIELNSDIEKVNEVFIADLKIFNKQLKKAYDNRFKLDNDYFKGNLESSTYNRLMSNLQKDIEKIERNIKNQKAKLLGMNLR